MGKDFKHISDELLASYLDGNTSANETGYVLDAMACDSRLQEFMEIAHDIDIDLNINRPDILPMAAMAANNNVDNLCDIKCERYAMICMGLHFPIDELVELADKRGWLRSEGTPLHHIGRIAEANGLTVTRQYDGLTFDINKYRSSDKQVLVTVNKATLYGNDSQSPKPDHVVLVSKITSAEVKIFDPADHYIREIPIESFHKAWSYSCNYIVIISHGIDDYEPHPIDLTDVELGDELIDLREAIAENAHEVWAQNRKKEGWSYGLVRDDEKKEHPDMVPYSRLPESEKLYDREMAINTIKLVKKLGYDIIKRK